MHLLIRGITLEDAERLETAFLEQGWHKPAEQFYRYYEEQQAGTRQVFVAETEGQPVGYVTLVPQAAAGPFAGQGIPEIVDFNVLKKWQRRGIGSALLDAAESAAFSICNRVSLGVGLHSGYGSAQRMYVKRGYVPDGSGVWYQDRQLSEMAECRNDDDLILHLSKTR